METSSSKSPPSPNLLPRGRGAITPSDGGQMVYREHYPLGADGCLVRHVDLSGPAADDTWTVHDWADDGRYEPQIDSVPIVEPGRPVSASAAARMIEEEV